MYTKEQIENDRKHYLKEQIQNAKELLSITQGTQLVWEVSCEYSPDKWDKNIIEILNTEEEAKEMLKNWKNNKETNDVELFYRPIVIDSDDGTTVNFQNLHYYKKDSYFVKSLNKYLYS